MTALLLLLLMAWMPVAAQNPFKQLMHETDPAYFKTDEARQVGDQLLLYQRVTGGWPKNIHVVSEGIKWSAVDTTIQTYV